MLSTIYGSLILDPNFYGKVYLKSFLIDGASVHHPFKFGYNFLHGEVNRDRQRLTSGLEEARILGQIWTEAIRLDKKSTLPSFVEMVQSDTLYADVDVSEDNIPLATTQQIWQYSLAEDVHRTRFYYYVEHGNKVCNPLPIVASLSIELIVGKDIELITKSLKKEAFPLKKLIWMSLRRHNLIRTPDEQRYHLLQSAPEEDLPTTLYSAGLIRTLKCALASDDRTRSLELEFRIAGGTDVEILLKDTKLLINSQCLQFTAGHWKAPCSLSAETSTRDMDQEQFSCMHVLTELYDLVLVELNKAQTEGHKGEPPAALRRRINEKALQMPCKVEVAHGNKPHQLDVTWVHSDSSKVSSMYGFVWTGRVTLHRESTCADKRANLLTNGKFL